MLRSYMRYIYTGIIAAALLLYITYWVVKYTERRYPTDMSWSIGLLWYIRK